MRGIAAAVGLASPSSVQYHLRRLEEAGIVRRARGAGSRATQALSSTVPGVNDLGAGPRQVRQLVVPQLSRSASR
ncbi:ArsR family transcriptional regulator [Streptomyces sp. NPDC058441]|uniref:LexA family protein n=1 Tax=Streptomyces sp. NPDC058441 TaxID=3346502 RepID=UPI003652AD94